MSHTVDLEVQILDLDALKASCEPLGMEFMENQKTHKSYFTEPCDHAIRVKGADSKTYEIGVTQAKVGRGYTLRADSYAGGYGLMDAIGGTQANKIKQEYSLQVAAKRAPRGYRMQRVQAANGHVQIRCVG